jgi:alkanesulfonate monooxygenase
MAADVAKLRALAVQAGRAPSDIKIFALATVITAATDEEAQAKYEDYRQYVSTPGALALMAGWSGIDFSRPDLIAEGAASSNAIQTSAAMFTKGGPAEYPNLDSLAQTVGLGGGGPLLVGGPQRIADELEAWAAESDLDGFNLAYAVMPETFADVVDHLVPELQRRGLFKKHYAGGTYREKLFRRGARLEDSHPAARMRRSGHKSEPKPSAS